MRNYETLFNEYVGKAKGDNGDSGYAIAAALLVVADAQYQTARAVSESALDSKDTNAVENAAEKLSEAIEKIAKEISNQ
jgi:hypothetical protein